MTLGSRDAFWLIQLFETLFQRSLYLSFTTTPVSILYNMYPNYHTLNIHCFTSPGGPERRKSSWAWLANKIITSWPDGPSSLSSTVPQSTTKGSIHHLETLLSRNSLALSSNRPGQISIRGRTSHFIQARRSQRVFLISALFGSSLPWLAFSPHLGNLNASLWAFTARTCELAVPTKNRLSGSAV